MVDGAKRGCTAVVVVVDAPGFTPAVRAFVAGTAVGEAEVPAPVLPVSPVSPVSPVFPLFPAGVVLVLVVGIGGGEVTAGWCPGSFGFATGALGDEHEAISAAAAMTSAMRPARRAVPRSATPAVLPTVSVR